MNKKENQAKLRLEWITIWSETIIRVKSNPKLTHSEKQKYMKECMLEFWNFLEGRPKGTRVKKMPYTKHKKTDQCKRETSEQMNRRFLKLKKELDNENKAPKLKVEDFF